ncbi:phospholipase-like protein [Tanacetum coccineum]
MDINILTDTYFFAKITAWWCGAVVVVWCCGGGVVLWWWCGAAVLRWLLFGSGVVVVNIENYEDEPVTLTCRNLDDSQENCVLIHFMTCRQVERSLEDTVVVPLTYHVNGHYIEFGWEEFCLITGLRFGPEFSERYEVGLILFRRLLFDSDTDGGHVTGQMLVDIINGEEFDNLHDEVALSVCQLVVLHLVLLGRQLAHNIPDWWLRLIDDKKIGKSILEGARPNRRLRPDAFEAKAEWWVRSREFFDGRIHEAPPIPTPIKLPSRYDVPKYVDRRYNECINSIKELQKKNAAQEKLLLEVYKFYKGQSKPKPVEIREHYGLSDFDFSVLQNKETSSSFFDMAQRTPTYSNTFEDPIPSRHPTSYPGTSHIATPMTLQGFASWSSTNQARPSQNPGSPYITTPMEQQGFAPWSSTNQARPSQNPGSPHIETPMAQQVEVQFWRDLVPYVCKGALYTENNPDRFGWLSEDHINCWMELMIRARPPNARYTVAKTGTSAMLDKSNKFVIETDFHLMGMLDGSSRPYPSWDDVDIDEMRRGKRETFPSKYQLSPFTCMPTTTVAPNKGAKNIRNTTRNAKVSPFNLGKASIDLNSPVGELMYMGLRATDDYISLHNVDPNKVVRNKYVNCMTFLESPESVFLDCFIKGFVVEVQFWRDLVPYVCKGALYTENNPDRFGWLSEDLMIRARPPSARYIVAKTGTSAMLDKSNKFVIETDFHLMGMLDGSSRPYHSWDDVDIVYMSINCGRNHWHINFWMELMIRDRPPGARYTVAKTGTSAMIEKSNKFVIETDFHLMGMLDGSSRPYPSWDDVDIVYMPINSGGDHWVTGVLNLRWSTIHVIDSLNNPHRKKQLMDHISKWTNVLNVLLEKAGHFERTGRRPYNFELVYNDGLEFASPQQGNSSDCGVVTCWVIESLCMGRAPVLYNVDPNFFFSDFRVQMCLRLYNCRCEDTQECGYD